MEIKSIKISICIATLNRARFIAMTLDSILGQATEEVEIVIVDGASTDNTREVIESFQKRFSCLRYFRQDMNQGVDRDFSLAVDLAKGDYCWLFSDDDLMKPGAIQTVCHELNDRFGLLIANAEVYNADFSETLLSRRLPLTVNRVYKPSEGNNLLADVGDYLSFIGCVIIKKTVWEARNKEEYYGSFFVHVGVIFQSTPAEDTLVIAEPLISIRYGNAMWLERYFEIWLFKWPELIWSFENYSTDAKRKVCAREPWRKLRTLLLERARGIYSVSMYRKWLRHRLGSQWDRVSSRALAYIPRSIANSLALFYYRALVRNPGRHLVIADLRDSRFYFRRNGKPDSFNAAGLVHGTSSNE